MMQFFPATASPRSLGFRVLDVFHCPAPELMR